MDASAASGASVVVHEDPDFGHAVQVQVGLHIHLPPGLHGPFVDHFTTAVGVGVAIDLARTNPAGYLRHGKVQRPTSVESGLVPLMTQTISDGSVWGGGILLRSFDQWWAMKHSEAADLVRQLPTILSGEEIGDDTSHIALADLSPTTAEAVITTLGEVEAEPALRDVLPVPVFRYRPS